MVQILGVRLRFLDAHQGRYYELPPLQPVSAFAPVPLPSAEVVQTLLLPRLFLPIIGLGALVAVAEPLVQRVSQETLGAQGTGVTAFGFRV
jgi:hypothetical protein